MAPDPLSSDALLALAPHLVSPSCTLSSPVQALALVVHTVHTALGFRLAQPEPLTGDDRHANRLPDEWPPHSSAGELKFRYKHDQSSLEFVVTVVELGDRALVAGAAVDNPARSSTFDFVLSDYFSPTSLSPSTAPLPIASLSPSNPFSTPARFNDLVHLYRLNVLQRLVPGLSKDGYEELRAPPFSGAASAGSSSGGAGGGAARGPGYYPDRGGPMGMFPPSRGGGTGEGEGGRRSPPAAPRTGGPAHPNRDRDPLAIPGSGGRGGFGGMPRADIGRRDLEPLGGMGGTFGGLPGMGGGGFGGLGGGGLGGLGGGMGGAGGGGGGGMLMGPDHPLFRERFGPGNDVVGGGEGRRWGGDGYLPPMGAPQGARFDPVGPTNGPPTGGLGGPNAGGAPQGPGQPPQGQGQPGGLGGMMGGGARRAHPDMEQPGTNEWQNSMFG